MPDAFVKVLVTGGAGFIGSHLVRALKGNEVVVVDNLHTGQASNLDGFDGMVLKMDAREVGTLTFTPEVIFHLGMYSSSPMYRADHGLVGEVVAGATAVFDLAAKFNAKVVYASTSSIYHGYDPPYEETMPVKVWDFYTEARVSVERLAQLYSMRNVAMPQPVGLRFFSVYGPGEESKGHFANMVTQFVWAARGLSLKNMGRKPTVYGDGSIERDLVHVDDVVEALLLAAKQGSGAINVGTGNSYSFNHVLDLLSRWAGVDVRDRVDFVPMPENYLVRQIADTRRAESLLGFKAKKDLQTGLKEML